MPNYTKARISIALLCATFSLPTAANAGKENPTREANSSSIRIFQLQRPSQEFICPKKFDSLDPRDRYIYVRPANLRQYFGGKFGIRASDTLWLYRSATDEGSLVAKLVFDMKGEPFLILQPPATAKSLDNLTQEHLEKMWGKASTNTAPYSTFSLQSKENYRVEIQAQFKQKKLAKYRVRIETFESPWAILDESKPNEDNRRNVSQSSNFRAWLPLTQN